MPSSRQAAIRVLRELRVHGHEAWFAGGCVRDMLLGLKPKDYDVATAALPGQVQKIFKKTVAVGKAFGVIRVLVSSSQKTPRSPFRTPHSIEVATFRTEGPYLDGRRPSSVRFTSAQEDAERRDFTINGLFYDPVRRKTMDYVGGKADLARRRLRAIGDPERRFQEDHLRLLRCIRFAAQLDFKIDLITWKALVGLARFIKTVSAERIRDELTKLLQAPHAAKGLRLLYRSGLMHWILPEIEAMQGVSQPRKHHPEGDVFVHTGLVLQALQMRSAECGMRNISTPSPRLAWSALLHDVGKPPTFELKEIKQRKKATEGGKLAQRRQGAKKLKSKLRTSHSALRTYKITFPEHARVGAEMADKILRRLRFSNDDREAVVEMTANHMTFKDVQEMRISTLKRLLARPTFEEEMALHRADCLACHGNLSNWYFLKRKRRELSKEQIRPPRLITGHDLIALGLKPGPEFGRILRELEEVQLEGKVKTPSQALEWVKKSIKS